MEDVGRAGRRVANETMYGWDDLADWDGWFIQSIPGYTEVWWDYDETTDEDIWIWLDF